MPAPQAVDEMQGAWFTRARMEQWCASVVEWESLNSDYRILVMT